MKLGISIVAAAVLAAAFAVLPPGTAGGAPPRFATLEEAVAAGSLDPALMRDLREHGHAEGLVSFEHEQILRSAEEAAPKSNGRAVHIVDAVTRPFAGQKARAFGHLKTTGAGRVVKEYEFLPVSFVRFDSGEALLDVLNTPGVTGVSPNRKLTAGLAESLPLVGQPLAAASGYSGAGTEVAVLDMRLNLAALGCPGLGCVVSENLDYGANDLEGDTHGTNVAGIVAGVAPGTRILAMDIFRREANGRDVTYDADITAAINDVIARRAQGRNIRAINMSIERVGTYFTSACSTSPDTGTPPNPFTALFATVRSAGILPVVASGNSAMTTAGFQDGVAYPGCTAGALSVGAVHDANRGQVGCDMTTAADQIACFSQGGPNLKLLAPGAQITAAGVVDQIGTSMAAPHVAGAAAVLAAAKPSAPAWVIEQALAINGPQIVDRRFPGPPRTHRRLDVCEALKGLLGRTTVRVTAPALSYTASACEANNVTVSLASGIFKITDTGAPIVAGTGCSAVAGNPNTVNCLASGISRLSINTGDRNDTVSVNAATPASIAGGPGDDTLSGGSAIDTLSGDEGRDRLDGAGGNDLLRGGLGADVMVGGLGTDQTDYSSDIPGGRGAGVTVTIDDVANDGGGGWRNEGDNVTTSVESLVGTLHDDSLSGSGASNALWGSTGADTLRGGVGNDTLHGEVGADSLFGGPGRDDLRGGHDRDALAGEDGDDVLDGGPGSDPLNGVFDGADTLSGGAGLDEASYFSHYNGVTVSLDGVANDGSSGEADNVDAENVTGSPFADTLRGNKGANDLRGRGGGDVLHGELGVDWLYGEEGNDSLVAKHATTFLADTDGRVDCGLGGLDFAQVDAGDPVFGCEAVW